MNKNEVEVRAMAVSKYNLDQIVSKYIHRPILAKEDLPPLYARMGAENETSFDAEGMKNPKWQQAVLTTYNSPTNIRRLFITGKHVYIQYYKPPIVKGKPSTAGNWAEYTFTNNDSLEVIGKNGLIGTLGTDRIEIVKTGLGALSNHWKVSNIEEIYIDHWILVSSDVRQRYSEAEGVLQACLTGKQVRATSQLLLSIFEQSNGDNIKNIRTRFPRLKTLALLSNLDQIMQVEGSKIRDTLPNSVNDIGKEWWKCVNNSIRNSFGTFVVSDVPGLPSGPNNNFAIRPGIYRFDAEVLSDYVEKYKARVLELGRQQRDKKAQQGKEEEKLEKSEYEVYLDSLKEQYSEAIVKAAIQLTFAHSSKEEIDKSFNSMSTEGRQYYRKLLGK